MASLINFQPRVVFSEPLEGQVVSPLTSVTVEFSLSIDPQSIGPTSFALVKIEGEEEVENIAEDVADGDREVVAGAYEISADNLRADFRPENPLEDALYGIVVTSLVHTADLLPFNQKPGERPTPFWSTFKVEGSSASESAGGGGTGGTGTSDSGGSAPPRGPRPSWLVINELFYDAVGDETDGQLFVELAGESGADISGYSVVLVNGSGGVITETIKIPEGSVIPADGIFLIADSRTGAPEETNIAGADFVDNFDPQNGPDCVELLDDHGALFDALGYGSPLPEAAENELVCFEGSPAVDASAGKSLSRIEMIDTQDNSSDFVVLDVPTPGTP